MSRALYAVLIALAVSASGWSSAAAQVVGDEPGMRGPRFLLASRTGVSRPLDVGRTPILAQRITIDVDGLSIRAALAAISTQAGFRLVYSTDVVNPDTHVHLKAAGITVAAALTDVLGNAGVDVVFDPTGASAALVRRPQLAALQTGAVAGRVTDATSGSGLADVQIRIEGTGVGTTTNDSGFYQIRRLAAGTYRLHAQRIGYRVTDTPVVVTADATTTLDLTLLRMAEILSAVEISATGELREAREVGNASPVITPDSLNLAASPTFATVLEASAPGVTVTQSSGTTGSGARIRIRGANSPSLGLEPLLVVDGVQVDNNPSGFAGGGAALTGGQEPSRINDLKAEDIASVQVLEGPAATGLYGTAAANGVLIVTTKRGRAGPPRWSLFAENGTLKDETNYPANYAGFSTKGAPDCALFLQGLGACTLDSLQHFSPLRGPGTPFRLGRRQQYGGSVSGGNDAYDYYISSDWQLENGVYQTDNLQATHLRGNFSVRPSRDLTFGFNTGYVASNTELPQNDALSNFGILFEGLLGSSTPDNGNLGYLPPTNPTVTRFISTQEQLQHWTAGASSSYHPLSWLNFDGTVGVDISNRNDNQTVPPGLINFLTYAIGSRTRNQLQTENYDLNLNGTARLPLTRTLTSVTTAGATFRRTLDDGNTASGLGLAGGTSSLNGVTQQFAVGEVNLDNRTIGAYVQEQLALNDRLFVSGGVRGDKNSAFGTSFGVAYYPTAQASWVLSEEPFFPKPLWLDALKLRAAYGQSGLRPNALSALTYQVSIPVTAPNGSSVAGLLPGGLGNPDLKPERTNEWEGGLDLSLFHDRASFQGTYFDKRSTDLLLSRVVPPSVGGATSQLFNVGQVSNRGVELQGSIDVMRSRPATVTIEGNFSTLENRVDNLGSVKPIVLQNLSGSQQIRAGYQLGGFWQPAVTYKDANHDGIIEPNEITIGDSAVFMGNDLPTRTASLAPSVTLFKILRLRTLFDYRGGYKLLNGTAAFRCAVVLNCSSDYVKGTPLADQAAVLAYATQSDIAGYIEDATFWKWREVAVTLLLPNAWASKIAARGASLTASWRNLRTWTKYKGFDPEVSAFAQGLSPFQGQFNYLSADLFTQPPVRYFVVRLSLDY